MNKKRKLRMLLFLLGLLAFSWLLYEYTKIILLIIGGIIASIIVIVFISIRISNKERNKYLSLLRSSNQSNRINGAKLLVRIKALETVDDLFDAFNKEKISEVRKAIIEALYDMNLQYHNYDKGRIDSAALTLDLPRQEIVLQKYILPPLRKAIHSENKEEREAAIMALIWIGTKEAFETLKESSIEFVSPDIITLGQQDIQFTVFYPILCNKTESNSIYVYAYINEMLKHVYKDILNNTNDFGESIPNMLTLKQTIKLLNNTIITIVPECDEVNFTPQSMTNNWNCEMVRFNFSFKIKDGVILNDEELNIRISVRIYSIEIAHIQLKLRLIDKSLINERQNPLAAAKYSCTNFIPYQKIFVSYSREDKSVVSVYKVAQEAAGNDVFVDTYSIRAGEDWRFALAKAIDTADIFQLFWSENSAKSPSVKDEWDYALNYRCPENKCENFIRPIYWDEPMPKPPDELKHLNFKYIELNTGYN